MPHLGVNRMSFVMLYCRLVPIEQSVFIPYDGIVIIVDPFDAIAEPWYRERALFADSFVPGV